MTFTIPLWPMTGAGGFALGVAFTFWVGLRYNARQVKVATATKAEALKAVMTRGPGA